MSILGGTTLAAVFTPNPDHPLTWINFVGYVLLIIGCAIALIGIYAAITTYRDLDPSRRRSQALPLGITAGVFVVIGAAVAAFGAWIF